MENETINQVETDVKARLQKYANNSKGVLVALGIGASLYLLGRAKGAQLGYAQGLSEGYSKGVSEIASMVKQVRKSIES